MERTGTFWLEWWWKEGSPCNPELRSHGKAATALRWPYMADLGGCVTAVNQPPLSERLYILRMRDLTDNIAIGIRHDDRVTHSVHKS
jgi:hypothetical protein